MCLPIILPKLCSAQLAKFKLNTRLGLCIFASPGPWCCTAVKLSCPSLCYVSPRCILLSVILGAGAFFSSTTPIPNPCLEWCQHQPPFSRAGLVVEMKPRPRECTAGAGTILGRHGEVVLRVMCLCILHDWCFVCYGEILIYYHHLWCHSLNELLELISYAYQECFQWLQSYDQDVVDWYTGQMHFYHSFWPAWMHPDLLRREIQVV